MVGTEPLRTGEMVEYKHMEQTIIFGIQPVVEAIKTGKVIDKLLIQRDLKAPGMTELRKVIKKHKIPFSHVPVQRIAKYTSGNHQGVLGFIAPIDLHDIETLLPQLFEMHKSPIILMLDRITDVRNFGAICRTAECAGVNAIVVPKRESAQINGDAIKTSAGALTRIPICKVDNLTDCALLLKDSGLTLIGCTEKTNDSLYNLDCTGPTAIVMGNEEKGISNQLLKICSYRAKIPMMGAISSLNVSVATGIILYELVKQREKN